MSLRLQRVTLHEVGPFVGPLTLELPEGRDPTRADLHLLVGPNGCGKSTVLTAIAQHFAGKGDTGLWRRGRAGSGAELFFRVDNDYHPVVLSLWREADGQWATSGLPLDRVMRSDDYRVRYACFAYGGLRAVEESGLDAIRELIDDPLTDAAAPNKPTGMRDFTQWVANTIAREAISARDGDGARATARRAALTRVEQAMEAVVGEPVRLRLADDPFRVVAQLGAAAEVPLAQLADGVQSLLSWVGDLLMRMDRVKWEGDLAVTERRFLLLLDEVEVHLHPAWQRKVLPMLERLFPNAQVVLSTHSPFVVNSATDAWIHRFRLSGGTATVDPPLPSRIGTSAAAVLEDVLGVDAEFDVETERHLAEFRRLRDRRLVGERVDDALAIEAAWLRARGPELANLVEAEWRQLQRRLAVSA